MRKGGLRLRRPAQCPKTPTPVPYPKQNLPDNRTTPIPLLTCFYYNIYLCTLIIIIIEITLHGHLGGNRGTRQCEGESPQFRRTTGQHHFSTPDPPQPLTPSLCHTIRIEMECPVCPDITSKTPKVQEITKKWTSQTKHSRPSPTQKNRSFFGQKTNPASSSASHRPVENHG